MKIAITEGKKLTDGKAKEWDTVGGFHVYVWHYIIEKNRDEKYRKNEEMRTSNGKAAASKDRNK
jgi:hypothetical protein